jgi:hypothetical protein
MNIGWEKLIQTEGPNPDATEQDQNNDLCVKSKRGMKATLGQQQNENRLMSGVLRGKKWKHNGGNGKRTDGQDPERRMKSTVKKTERAHSSQD